MKEGKFQYPEMTQDRTPAPKAKYCPHKYLVLKAVSLLYLQSDFMHHSLLVNLVTALLHKLQQLLYAHSPWVEHIMTVLFALEGYNCSWPVNFCFESLWHNHVWEVLLSLLQDKNYHGWAQWLSKTQRENPYNLEKCQTRGISWQNLGWTLLGQVIQ